ncbi:MAG: acetate--CoA ligase family protein [Candidatus Rokubacteria bacterium]|nr:acetate--CoA ligase family protein [Candidatus Rokubacteria bacterium]
MAETGAGGGAVRARGMEALLRARSVAILGASGDPRKVSGRPQKYLLRHAYRGAIYPVNPTATEVQGLPAYPSLAAIPGPVELAVVCVPAAKVPDAMTACGARGVPAAVILTAGFAETGADGARIQDEVALIARAHGIAVCGPNSVGIVNVWERLAASFSAALEQDLVPGPIAFVSQSGAMGTTIFNRMQDEGLGFSYFVSSGNEAVVESLDYMEALLPDERTRVIGGYIEGFRDGRKLFGVADLAHRLGKPIVLLKAGRTESGTRAALSHTASVTGSHRVYEAALRQAGVIAVHDIEELVDACRLLSRGRTFPGRRIGVLTGSGGAGVLAADHLGQAGLDVPSFSAATREALTAALPPFAACNNPVDVTAQIFAEPQLLEAAYAILTDEEVVDGLALVLTMAPAETARRLAEDVVRFTREGKKPLAVCWLAGSLVENGRTVLREAGVPLYASLPALASGLRVMVEAGRPAAVPTGPAAQRPPLPPPLRAALARGGLLPYARARELLACFGIPGPREAIVKTARAARRAALDLGGPVALKLLSAALTHKTDAGAVRLGLAPGAAVEKAARELLALGAGLPPGSVEGLLVQEMVEGGVEALVGAALDPQFGPVVTFGLGGVFVEVLRDVVHRLPPLGAAEAEAMTREIAGARILDGLRGQPPRDRAALVGALLGLSALLQEAGGLVAELDANPLLLLPEGRGVTAVDVRVVGHGPSA